MHRWMLSFLIAWVGAVVAGCFAPPSPDPAVEAARAFCGDDYEAVEARIDQLLEALTLEQKASLMHGAASLPVDGTWQTTAIEDLGIPGFHMIDGPRGVSRAAGHATAFPVGSARGATWDPDLEERVGATIGREARARGADVILAPTINVLRHPRWGRSQETYGEDPFHIGTMAVGFIRGAQQYVVSSVKHFDGNSIEDTRFYVDVTMDERTLREVYLPQFRRAVQEAQAGSVMSAYNSVNGSYCSENDHLLGDILKGEWGFRGFVVSDWFLGVQSTVAAAEAGLDLEMPSDMYFGQDLVVAVDQGEVDEAVLDEAVRRLLRVQLCFGLDTDPPIVDPSAVETAEARALALEVAERGIVLLRNEGPLLPFAREGGGGLVVTGPLADVENIGDTGSSNVEPSTIVTPLEGLVDLAGPASVTFVEGDLTEPADRDAVAAAGLVVVVVGLTAALEGEGLISGGDRDTMALPQDQVDLIRSIASLNDAVVVVLEGGSAITMEGWVDDVEAVVMAWYPGMEGGTAIAEVLYGDVNPSGRLPVSFPVTEADLPPFDNTSHEVTYEYDHGYRYLDRQGTEPRFPFGFGLSYTTFRYDDLSLERSTITTDGTLRATVEVTNVGELQGIETVQLYLSAPGSRVERPVRALAAFGQVELSPGETGTVTLEVPARELAFFDTEADAWEVEPITYDVAAGPSSRDLPLTASFDVTAVGPWSAE